MRTKELIDEIANQSGYFKYQIADVLHSLAVVLTRQVSNGDSVYVEGIGKFSPKNPYRLRTKSVITGGDIDVMTKKSCIFKPDSRMINSLNKEI